jgi:hypothetical protein
MPDRHQNHGLHKICNCPRRGWPKCPHPWHLNFKHGETHYRFSLDRHLGRHLDSKTAAETEAENIRTAIRNGEFGKPAPREDMTLRQLAGLYKERYVATAHSATAAEYAYSLGTICRTEIPFPATGSAPLGDWRVLDIVTDTIERFREIRRGQGTGLVGVNRNVRRLRALFNWGIRVGYVERTPFKRGTGPDPFRWTG